MGFAEAWKKTQTTEEKKIHQEALPKLPEPPFDSFDSDPKRHISEKTTPPASTPNPAPRTPEARPGDDWFDSMIQWVLDGLDDAGIVVTAVPFEARRKARTFEVELTEAANADDRPRFWRALREWERTWKGSLH
jgi:hypothetical protein